MPAVRTYITGLDDALKCFDRAPSNLLKVVKQALRDGGKQAAKEIRKAMPRRFKRLVSCKVVKGSVSGDWSALVGAFNKAKSGTDEPDDWYKAYWKNYGTLTKRDKDHKFDYPIKKLSRKRRNEVGQDAEKFYDKSIDPAQNAFIRAFQDSIKKQEDKLKER
jgi:hypothetical protein